MRLHTLSPYTAARADSQINFVNYVLRISAVTGNNLFRFFSIVVVVEVHKIHNKNVRNRRILRIGAMEMNAVKTNVAADDNR